MVMTSAGQSCAAAPAAACGCRPGDEAELGSAQYRQPFLVSRMNTPGGILRNVDSDTAPALSAT